MLDVEAVAERLKWPEAWHLEAREQVGSTNDAVLTGEERGEEGAVFFAEIQTDGRGRRGNRWFSGAVGENLAFSCLVTPPWPPQHWGRLTHLTAVALKRVLEDYPPAVPQVKWPNDLYLRGKKVAGILVETEFCQGSGQAVIGIGLNVNAASDAFPSDIAATATSLRAVTQAWIDREALAAGILDQLTEVLRCPLETFPAILEEITDAHYLLGRAVRARVGSRVLTGMAVALAAEGELVIEDESGRREALTSCEEIRLAE